MTYHVPVMVEETMEGLALKEGVYFDGTVGGGGHSFEILSRCKKATLIGTDRDEEAIAAAKVRLSPFGDRAKLFRANYKDFEEILHRAGADKLDGVLLDFGISSHQIDDAERGFSYRTADAPLDMRMDRTDPLTAEEVVNEYPEEKLYRILKEYGEERFASLIARNLTFKRKISRIKTCGELARIVEESIPPKFRSAACARQSFQAIRIEVNGELEGLGECVKNLARKLKTGGRICILTFHSLEDRIVKTVFREMSEECVCPKSFPVCVCGKKKELEILTKRPKTPSEEEKKENTRSQCAKLRIAEKV